MNLKLIVGTFFTMVSLMVSAQGTKIDPTRINWPLLTGSGAPSALSCTSANYGQPYQDSSVSPTVNYSCTATGWQKEYAPVSPSTFGALCDATWNNATNTYTGTDDRVAFIAMLSAINSSGANIIQLPPGKNCRIDPPGGIITGYSIATNVVTVTMNNSLMANDVVTPQGLSTGTYLNGAPLVVLSTGLSSTQFEATFYHADVSFTSDSGYGVSPALDIEYIGLIWNGSNGTNGTAAPASGASPLSASISAGQHGVTASVGPFVQFSYDKSANVTTWSLDGSGNLTVNFIAMPGGLKFRASESIILSNTGVVDATYHSVATVTTTQITITGVAGSAASGSGGLLHEPWTNFDADGKQGSEWNNITFSNYNRVNQTNCSQNWFYCEYVQGTYGMLDYRGGNQILNNVKVTGTQYGFYGVQSDFTYLNNFSFQGGQMAAYVGPNSTPFYINRLNDLADDVSVWIDGLPYQGITVSNSHFRSGSSTTSQIVVANKLYDSTAALGGGLPTSGVLLTGNDFEFGGGCPGTSTPNSFISIDSIAMGSATVTKDWHIVGSSFVNYASSPCNVPTFISVGRNNSFGEVIGTADSNSTLTNLIDYTPATGSPVFYLLNAVPLANIATNAVSNSGGAGATYLSYRSFSTTNNPTFTGTVTLPSGTGATSLILPYIDTANLITSYFGCKSSGAANCLYFETGGASSPYGTGLYAASALFGTIYAKMTNFGFTANNNNGAYFSETGQSADPGSYNMGQRWFNTTELREKLYDGTNLDVFAWLSDLHCTAKPTGTPSSTTYLRGDCSWATTPIGTVTSVALKSATPNLFSGTEGTPVTTSGDLDPDAQLATQSANCLVAGPETGAAAKPTCRAAVAADLPSSAITGSLGYTPAASGANSDITSIAGLTTPLSTAQGGNGSVSIFTTGATVAGGAARAFVQNQVVYMSFQVTNKVTVGYFDYQMNTADNSANLYDIGVYSTTGSLLFHTGATAGSTLFSATGLKGNVAIAGGGTYTLYPGTYLFAYTTNCASACAVFDSSSQASIVYYYSTGTGSTSSGALGSSITAPSKNISGISPPAFAIHN